MGDSPEATVDALPEQERRQCITHSERSHGWRSERQAEGLSPVPTRRKRNQKCGATGNHQLRYPTFIFT
jgi:hypothetical protein